MKPCVVGIGGAGGNVLRQFLQSEDLELLGYQFGELLAYGDVKGIWLESASQDALGQNYYGNLVRGHYPCYLICHEAIGDGSSTRDYVMEKYGFDLKAPGFDRRAEYLKAVFEIFEIDPELKDRCSQEFKGYENPLSDYMWKVGIKPFTIISIGRSSGSSESTSKAEGQVQDQAMQQSQSTSGSTQPISKSLKAISFLSNKNHKKSSKLCDSILFVASLGGGTGTGFINPITNYVRSEERIFPIFTLGILTEKGSDKRHASEGQRDLGAIIAMYDLLTKESGEGIDGLILVDNQILFDRFDGNYSAMDGEIYSTLKPLLDLRNYPGDQLQDDSPAIRRVLWEVDVDEGNNQGGKNGRGSNNQEGRKLLPPVLVPCYHGQPDYVGNVTTLVEGALGKPDSLCTQGSNGKLSHYGKLFPCDPVSADRALVFTRGFFSIGEIMDAVQSRTHLEKDKIKIYRKLGDSKNIDILILLRNPYGGVVGEHKRPGTLEWRFHDIVAQSLNYIDQNADNILGFQGYQQITKDKLRNYFYGENGLRDELYNCLDRLENGERPIFRRPIRIFGDGSPARAAPDSCVVSHKMLTADKYDLREMVRAELKEILRSEDCRKRIREILQS